MTRNSSIIPPGEYREVSELKIQYQCEYRLYLQRQIGKTTSPASRRGVWLHAQVGNMKNTQKDINWIIRLVLLLLIIVTGMLWILG